MAKKRKQRSSEPELTKTPDPQPQHEEEENQPQNVAVDADSKQVDVQQQQQQQDPEEEEEEVEEVEEVEEEVEVEVEEEEDDDAEDEAIDETQDGTTNDAVQSEANGAKEDNTEQIEQDDDDDDDDEPLEKLLEPFGKDQLITLLKQAVDKYPDLLDSVCEIADADPAHRKIFVHGLGWDTTAETLTEEFGKYGEIEDCKAVTDRVSGKSKGYAFILFKHRSGARKALKEPQKKIGNRTTSCQLASAGPVPAPPPTAPPVSEYTQRKIFVSNVSADIDPDKLFEFFKQYGEIEDGPLGLDKHTGKPKGFALFVFKTVESAKRALEEPHKTFEGHTLHCQKAIDGPKPGKQGGYAGSSGGSGSGSAGGGGGGGGHHQYQQHHHHHHQPHFKKGKYSSSGGSGPGPGHMMAPSGPGMGFNPGVAAAQALNPALGQALTALLTTQGAGLGLGNLLGGLGGAPVNQGGLPTGYGNQAAGGYGGQPGYQNPQMGQGGAGRPQPGGAPYMGH